METKAFIRRLARAVAPGAAAFVAVFQPAWGAVIPDSQCPIPKVLIGEYHEPSEVVAARTGSPGGDDPFVADEDGADPSFHAIRAVRCEGCELHEVRVPPGSQAVGVEQVNLVQMVVKGVDSLECIHHMDSRHLAQAAEGGHRRLSYRDRFLKLGGILTGPLVFGAVVEGIVLFDEVFKRAVVI